MIKNTLSDVPIQVPLAGPVDTSEEFSQVNPSVRAAAPGNLLAQLEQQAGQQNQSAEKMADQVKADRLTALDAKAFEWIARGHDAHIKLGDIFNEVKDLLAHGEWEPHFAKNYAPRGIALRTAQAYMRISKEAKELAKNANPALFPPATDAQAAAVNDAVEQAKQQVANATGCAPVPTESKPTRKPRKSRVRLDGIYWLPLFLTAVRKDNLDELRKSQNWRVAELTIIATIDNLFVRNGLVNPPKPLESQAVKQAHKRVEILPDEPFEGSDANQPPVILTTDMTDEEESEI